MRIVVCGSAESTGSYAAAETAAALNSVLRRSQRARLLLSTGESQFTTLRSLVRRPVHWARVDAFHLDEYSGLDDRHPASFRRYLRERLAQLVPVTMHYVNPSSPQELRALSELVAAAPMDVALVGIGENGHLAFNDPPADFETTETYLEVELDDRCRAQQVREGWFPSVGAVPSKAVTMSVSSIMNSRLIVSAVPYAAKASVIRDLVCGQEVTPALPASILKTHPNVTIVLDRESSQFLPKEEWGCSVVL
jgi:glucosamine-6-phosphate deaminase